MPENDRVIFPIGDLNDAIGSLNMSLPLPMQFLGLLASSDLPPIRLGWLAATSGFTFYFDSQFVRHAAVPQPLVSLGQIDELAGDQEPSPVKRCNSLRSALSCRSSLASSVLQ
jgi:hypothetical protein